MECTSIVLVDSTRSGKRMPDALSKTVPIWCAVINRAIKTIHSKDTKWNVALYCPPGVVSGQEHSQIDAQLDTWATSLVVSYHVVYQYEPLVNILTSNLPMPYQICRFH